MSERAQRLDHLLVERGLAESREKAQRLIYAGSVRVNGQKVAKPGQRVASESRMEVETPARFVGRGGEKLEHAFDFFSLDVHNMVCLDVGASTGGFTDCMLQHGALKVYAVDVGRGQLHWNLRNDPRVVVMEKVNARYLRPEDFPEQPEFAAVDVSFISLTKILPAVNNILCSGAVVISLIKPQFEAGRKDVSRGGVVRDPELRSRIVDQIRLFGVNELGLEWMGVCESPVRGPAGNVELLAHWKKP